MKMNNYGFGFKETFLYLSILFLLLLFTSCSISSFYKDLESGKKDDYSNLDGYLFDVENNKKPTTDSSVNNNNTNSYDNYPSYDTQEDNNFQVIQMDHYYNAEKKLYSAVTRYAVENNIPKSEYLYTITLDDLVKLKYMDKVVDYVDGSTCSGYGNIMSDDDGYQVSVYISCSNYKTEGYR